MLLSRGSMRGALSPGEARQMALHWMETAEATESDCLVATAARTALGTGEARRQLTQEILRAFEPVLRQYPDQWFHFVPVWPEAPGR